jgi:hypothetical protein
VRDFARAAVWLAKTDRLRQIEVLGVGCVCRLAPRDRLDFDESTIGHVL